MVIFVSVLTVFVVDVVVTVAVAVDVAELATVVVLANPLPALLPLAMPPVSDKHVTTPFSHSPSLFSLVELSFFSSLITIFVLNVAVPLSELCVFIAPLLTLLVLHGADVGVGFAVEHGGVLVPDEDEFGGELERLEFDVLLLLFADVADDVADVEFAARSRPPVFCCCSRCNLGKEQCEREISSDVLIHSVSFDAFISNSRVC